MRPNIVTVWLYNYFLAPLINSHLGNIRQEIEKSYKSVKKIEEDRTQEVRKIMLENQEMHRVGMQHDMKSSDRSFELHRKQVDALQKIASSIEEWMLKQ